MNKKKNIYTHSKWNPTKTHPYKRNRRYMVKNIFHHGAALLHLMPTGNIFFCCKDGFGNAKAAEEFVLGYLVLNAHIFIRYKHCKCKYMYTHLHQHLHHHRAHNKTPLMEAFASVTSAGTPAACARATL